MNVMLNNFKNICERKNNEDKEEKMNITYIYFVQFIGIAMQGTISE